MADVDGVLGGLLRVTAQAERAEDGLRPAVEVDLRRRPRRGDARGVVVDEDRAVLLEHRVHRQARRGGRPRAVAGAGARALAVEAEAVELAPELLSVHGAGAAQVSAEVRAVRRRGARLPRTPRGRSPTSRPMKRRVRTAPRRSSGVQPTTNQPAGKGGRSPSGAGLGARRGLARSVTRAGLGREVMGLGSSAGNRRPTAVRVRSFDRPASPVAASAL